MSSRRTLILAVSLVVGLFAAFLVFNYVNGVEKRAEGGQDTKSVLVANVAIVAGSDATTLDESNAFGPKERRITEIPRDALDRSADILTQVAKIDIQPGTILTSAMFEPVGAASASSDTRLGDDKVAITVSVDAVKGVARLVEAGGYVNITVLGRCNGNNLVLEEQDAGATDDGATAQPTDLFQTDSTSCASSLYQKAEVYAVGRSLGSPVAVEGEEATAETGSDLISFLVPPEVAQVLAFMTPGTLYLSLVSDEYIPVEIAPTVYPFEPAGVTGGTPFGADPEQAEKDK